MQAWTAGCRDLVCNLPRASDILLSWRSTGSMVKGTQRQKHNICDS